MPKTSDIAAAFRWSLWQHGPLLSLAVLSTVLLLLLDATSVPHLARGLEPAPWTWLLVPVLPLNVALVSATVDRIRHKASWAVALRQIPLRSIVSVAVVVAATRILLASTLAWKLAIPRWRGFNWDTTFHSWDQALMGTSPILPGWLLVPLDAFYGSFFVLFPAMVLWYAWHPDGRSRRFLTAVALAWVGLGTIAATVFASAGPCYYGQVTGILRPTRISSWLLGVSRSWRPGSSRRFGARTKGGSLG